MTIPQSVSPFPVAYLIRVTAPSPGQFIAEAVGLPGLCATADTREAAIEQVWTMLDQRLASGELVLVTPNGSIGTLQPRRRFAGHAKDDPDFDQYLEEIRRFREEADQQQCSNSSSTPTT
ncbi:MAG: hypothetical protein HYS12_05390 [Planctomycetes bacterium]|nr:hypothetical protein [Planctomycetota bacterium]